MTASAVVATIGNGAAFSKGRDFGAWLGLVPKQPSVHPGLRCVGKTVVPSVSNHLADRG
jgi:hypothetical protein